MSQPTTLPSRPTQEPTGRERNAVRVTTIIPNQNLEDLELVERVRLALCATGYGPLRAVEVTVDGRRVLLRGRVPSYYLKQMAQATALTVLGTRQIHNDLEVVKSEFQATGGLPYATATP
jgi:osmotically-inducible protein OsmY